MRYEQGDYVVHPGQGVCRVNGVDRRHTIVGASADCPGREVERLEYALTPVAGQRVSIHYPVEKEDELRPVIGKADARRLIKDAPLLESDTFDKPQSWTVRDHFIGCMRAGDCTEAMRVVKTLHERVASAQRSGRKPKACYTSVLSEAKQRLYDELSIALETTEDRVDELLRDSFERAGDLRRA